MGQISNWIWAGILCKYWSCGFFWQYRPWKTDYVKVLTNTNSDGINILHEAEKFINENLGLTLNKNKSGVFSVFNIEYLGYKFTKVNDKIETIQNEQNKNIINYETFQTSAIQKIDQNYHLIADGILTWRDFTLLFENEEKKMYLPVEVVDFLNIYSNVTFSSDFFKFAKEKEIIITFYDKFGRYSGVFLPPYLNRSSKTLISQVSIFLNEEKRLSIAKLITEASCHNIRSNVRYYNKYLKDGRLYKSLKEFDEFILKIEKCESLENLFLIEAQGKEEYFSRFNIFLKDDSFDFENRNRRPPKDPINALISFGNTILYQIIAREIYKTGLDIRISFMHSPNKRNESLNLDIADIFKPIIIDRVIFTMINKKIINEKTHFESSENNGVYLNKEGKKIFLKYIDEKMYSKITVDNISVTYLGLIRREILNLLKYVEKDEPYKPFKYY